MATPSAGSPRILLVLGGTWHDFDGFGRFFSSRFPNVEITRDLGRLARPDCDIVVLYTCLTPENEEGSPSAIVLRDGHARPLAEWVARGGALLGLHGATVSGRTSPELGRLLGGVFVEHPEPFEFTVFPVAGESPAAFAIRDEFYIQQRADDIAIRMIGLHEGAAHPLVWTRREGRGRVAHIAMGHDEAVWRHPSYGSLLGETIAWLTPART